MLRAARPTPAGDYDATLARHRRSGARHEGRLGRTGWSASACPGALSAATGLRQKRQQRRAHRQAARPRPRSAPRPRRCASRTTPTASRCPRPSTARRPGHGGLRRHPRHRRGGGIVVDGKVHRRPQSHRRRMGAQSASLAAAATNGPARLLLRQAWLHRDVPLRRRPCPRSRRTAPAAERRGDRGGRPARRPRATRRWRATGPPRARRSRTSSTSSIPT